MNVDRFRNANGTYNGIKAMAAWSGLSEAEVHWTADRMQTLVRDGATADQAKTTVKGEARFPPWLLLRHLAQPLSGAESEESVLRPGHRASDLHDGALYFVVEFSKLVNEDEPRRTELSAAGAIGCRVQLAEAALQRHQSFQRFDRQQLIHGNRVHSLLNSLKIQAVIELFREHHDVVRTSQTADRLVACVFRKHRDAQRLSKSLVNDALPRDFRLRSDGLELRRAHRPGDSDGRYGADRLNPCRRQRQAKPRLNRVPARIQGGHRRQQQQRAPSANHPRDPRLDHTLRIVLGHVSSCSVHQSMDHQQEQP